MSTTVFPRAASRLRLEPAIRLLPVSLPLGYLVALAFEPQATAYPLAVAARSHEAIIVLAPLAAAAGAWKAGRWRRSGWRSRPWRRATTLPAAWDILLTAAVQFTAYVAIAAWVAATSGRAVPLAPEVLAIAAAFLVGWTAVGFAVGWWVRAELALPAVVVGAYLAFVYPPAMEPLWLRHLTGTIGDCCFPDATLDLEAVRAAIIVAAAATLASLLVISSVQQAWCAVAAPIVLVTASVLAISMVDDLGADPVAPRVGPVECTGAPEVCVWPEQAGDLARVTAVVEQAAARWSELGLDVPRRLSPRRSDLTRRQASGLALWEHPTDEQVVHALAAGILPDPRCDGIDIGTIYESRAVAIAWLTMAGGIGPAEVRSATDPVAFQHAERLQGLDPTTRIRWLAAVERADPCRGDAVPVPQ
ncbi:MAG: hypothetical protein JWO77_2842 [Ilumatobacteraceae bacterium]|nr:hypothetical protein [Ilumatobacteraceae bacterium]